MPGTRKYSDRAAYLKRAVTQRRKKLRESALALKGNKCKICGYNRCSAALSFHHLDPSLKEFGIPHRGLTRSWKKIEEELKKCILICANCHAEIHAGQLQPPQEIAE